MHRAVIIALLGWAACGRGEVSDGSGEIATAAPAASAAPSAEAPVLLDAKALGLAVVEALASRDEARLEGLLPSRELLAEHCGAVPREHRRQQKRLDATREKMKVDYAECEAVDWTGARLVARTGLAR